MDICVIVGIVKEWSEPVCAFATLVLSVVVFFINRKVDAEAKRIREREAMLLQPARMSAWLEKPDDSPQTQRAVIYNATDLPVYNVLVTVVATKGHGFENGEARQGIGDYRKVFAVVPPGRRSFTLNLMGFGGMGRYPVLEVSFRCIDGRSWIRRGDGTLEQIDVDPFAYYGIQRPCTYGELAD